MFENLEGSVRRAVLSNMTKRKSPEDLKPARVTNGEIVCMGQCGKSLPATEEFYFFRKSSKNGKSYPSTYCKICERVKSAAARKARYGTADGGEAIRQQNQTWRSDNPEWVDRAVAKQNEKYATDEAFREKAKSSARGWRLRFPEKKRAANAVWHQRTKKRSYRKRALFATFFPDLKLRTLLRVAICGAMKEGGGSKAGRSVLKNLPYTPVELKAHLESLWESWMTWANYGPWSAHRRTWQIDHVTPQALLPFADFSDANFLRCWALSNLRPLESSKNLEKGARAEVLMGSM